MGLAATMNPTTRVLEATTVQPTKEEDEASVDHSGRRPATTEGCVFSLAGRRRKGGEGLDDGWRRGFEVKGKAVIDVVCNPLGKSKGALIQQFITLTFGSLANSTPYLGAILMVIVTAWLAAARSLDKQFTELRKEEELKKEMERAVRWCQFVSLWLV